MHQMQTILHLRRSWHVGMLKQRRPVTNTTKDWQTWKTITHGSQESGQHRDPKTIKVWGEDTNIHTSRQSSGRNTTPNITHTPHKTNPAPPSLYSHQNMLITDPVFISLMDHFINRHFFHRGKWDENKILNKPILIQTFSTLSEDNTWSGNQTWDD